MDARQIHEGVSDKYGRAAVAARSGKRACCGTSCCSGSVEDPITSDL